MMKRIAIVGTSKSSCELANGEPADVEIWGLGSTRTFLQRIDRFFEMHTRAWNLRRAGKAFWGHQHYLQTFAGPVYMQAVDETIANSIAYPLSEMREIFFKDEKVYFSSTVAYMFALAIAEKADEIRLFGVDMSSRMEYAHQRGGCEFFIGWARAIGIKVTIPDSSPIMKAPLYGFRRDTKVTQDTIMERIGTLRAQEGQQEAALLATRAAINENERWLGEEQGLALTEGVPANAPLVTANVGGRDGVKA